jgi:hypothetical protein
LLREGMGQGKGTGWNDLTSDFCPLAVTDHSLRITHH